MSKDLVRVIFSGIAFSIINTHAIGCDWQKMPWVTATYVIGALAGWLLGHGEKSR